MIEPRTDLPPYEPPVEPLSVESVRRLMNKIRREMGLPEKPDLPRATDKDYAAI